MGTNGVIGTTTHKGYLKSGAFSARGVRPHRLGARWNARWQPHALKHAGIFCYRGIVRGIVGEETA